MREILVLVLALAAITAQVYQNIYPSTASFQPQSVNELKVADSNPTYNNYQPHLGNEFVPTPILTGGVALQFAMNKFENQMKKTANGGFCADASSENSRCMLTFTFIVATPTQQTRIFEVPEIALDDTGVLPLSKKEFWGRTHFVNLPVKPESLTVLVHHRGLTFDADSRPISNVNMHLLDVFHVSLADRLPTVGGIQMGQQPNDYIGSLAETRLAMTVGIACQGTLIGPDCDLQCTRSTINANVASCQSNSTGYFAVCNWASANQVENCKRCPWGVREETYCQDVNGGVLEPATAGVVDTSYKTATIILACLLAIAFILVCGLFVLLAARRRAASKDTSLPGHNYRAEAQRPLVESRYSADGPTPAPRNLPPGLGTPPGKSALRRPILPPPAHLGGSNSVNDTLNNSIDVPMRPSRSEVV